MDLESTDDAAYRHNTATENSNSTTLAMANFFVALARILLILSLLVGIILLVGSFNESSISIAVAIAVLVGGTLQSLFLLLISSYIKSRTLNHVHITSMLSRHLSEIVKNTK